MKYRYRWYRFLLRKRNTIPSEGGIASSQVLATAASPLMPLKIKNVGKCNLKISQKAGKKYQRRHKVDMIQMFYVTRYTRLADPLP